MARTKRERETDRQTHRERERQRDRETDTETDRETDRQTEGGGGQLHVVGRSSALYVSVTAMAVASH